MKTPKAIASTFVQVKDETWRCYLWKTKHYDKVHGKDSGACTLIDEREMHFRDDNNFNQETICHELVHAYWSTVPLESIGDLPADKFEEVVASFVGKNFAGLYSDTLHVYNHFKKDIA